MELRHIRYFLAVAEELNFTRAAAKINIGQPPLSRQIRDLEEEIGAPLFLRLPQGVELSAAGHAFLPEARNLLARAGQAQESARRAAAGTTGTLRVGFTGSAAFHTAVASSLRRFRDLHRDVEIQLTEAPTGTLLSQLKAKDLDAAFVRPGAMPPASVRNIPLHDEEMLLVVPTGFGKKRTGKLPLRSIAGEPLILFPRSAGPGFHDEITAACRAAGFEPRPGQEVPQMTSIGIFVAAGLGVSMVPAGMARIQIGGVEYRRMEGTAPLARLSLVMRDEEPDPVVRNLIRIATAAK